jgi:UDP-2,4-diacetamido-2,4,6-trideoxy-beta-L-altropyranose hydrolase
MRVVFRTDSSSMIGSGHLMRCLTLARVLVDRDAEVSFVCNDLPGHLAHFIIESGFDLRLVSPDRDPFISENRAADYVRPEINWNHDVRRTQEALTDVEAIDWLVVDHYNLDERWEQIMRPHVGYVMVIDDLADRLHDCDLLLDQNYYEDFASRYDQLVPDHCRRLLGPDFAILRPEFVASRARDRVRDGTVSRILIFMGGADPQNVTETALEAIRMIHRPDIAVDVVVGAANPLAERIRTACRLIPQSTFHHRVTNMAELMAAADLAVGAGGSTTWERCCLGLPTIFIATARNEIGIARAAELAGVGSYLGIHYDVTASMIANEIRRLLEGTGVVSAWSERARSLVDGKGAERVCQGMLEFLEAEVTP